MIVSLLILFLFLMFFFPPVAEGGFLGNFGQGTAPGPLAEQIGVPRNERDDPHSHFNRPHEQFEAKISLHGQSVRFPDDRIEQFPHFRLFDNRFSPEPNQHVSQIDLRGANFAASTT